MIEIIIKQDGETIQQYEAEIAVMSAKLPREPGDEGEARQFAIVGSGKPAPIELIEHMEIVGRSIEKVARGDERLKFMTILGCIHALLNGERYIGESIVLQDTQEARL